MPRPRVCDEARVATAIRLPESLHRRLHEAAAVRQVSANLLVTSAVDDYLARLPPVVDLLAPGGEHNDPGHDERPEPGHDERPGSDRNKTAIQPGAHP